MIFFYNQDVLGEGFTFVSLSTEIIVPMQFKGTVHQGFALDDRKDQTHSLIGCLKGIYFEVLQNL